MKRFFQTSSSFGLAIILVFSLLATAGVAFFQQTLLNEKTYTRAMSENQVASRVHQTIVENMKYLMVENNIPQTLVEGIITESEVSALLKKTTSEVLFFLEGGSSAIAALDFSLYQQRIEQNLDTYLDQQETALSQQQLTDIAALETTLLQIIEGEIQLLNFAELSQSNLARAVVTLAQIMNDPLILFGLCLVNLLLFFPFVMIWRRRRARRYAWIGYPLLTAGLILLVVAGGGYLSGFYHDIVVQTSYIADTAVQVIQTYLGTFIGYGFGLLALGIASMSVYWRHLFRRYLYTSRQRSKANA